MSYAKNVKQADRSSFDFADLIGTMANCCQIDENRARAKRKGVREAGEEDEEVNETNDKDNSQEIRHRINIDSTYDWRVIVARFIVGKFLFFPRKRESLCHLFDVFLPKCNGCRCVDL